MANLFDTTNYPTREPDSLEAGDRWAWKRTDLISDYPSSAYTLSYVLRREITGERIAITASAGSDGYLVEVSSTTTAAYNAGRYHWDAYITQISNSERISLNSGTLEITPNKATSSDDPRSFAQVCLDNIETYLRDPNNAAAASYSIAGRSLSRWSRTDLFLERERLKGEVVREQRRERLARGMLTSATAYARFT
jgi:hypothetical protein